MLRYIPQKEPVIVRNGFNYQKLYDLQVAEKKTEYKLGYIGTVSSWFDFDTMVSVLDAHNDIMLHIIGPAGGYTKYESKSVHFEGVVEHDRLYEFVKEYDCLIMPFLVNQIVLAVDPVKLYEYIAFGKCVISVFYPEVERFGEYVYFYHTQEELQSLLYDLKQKGFPPKYNRAQQQKFMEENSWTKRAEMIREIIDEVRCD